MSSLIDLQIQIEKLQKQASDIKAKDFDRTVKEIQEKMRAFGITVKDLAPGKVAKGKSKPVGTKKRAAGGPSKTAGTAVAAKYRGPAGETWSGRGLSPRWLSTLVAQGRKKEEFLIAS